MAVGSRTTVVYVSNADSRDISVLGFDSASATLTLLQTVALPGVVMPLVISPSRRHLYAALRSEPFAVANLEIDPHDGTLTLLSIAALPDSMANVTSDRSGRHLFSASYGGSCLGVNPIGADGLAAAFVQRLATGRNAHAVLTDPSNRFLFVTTLGSDEVMQWRFDAATGGLAPNDPPVFKARAASGPRHLMFHPNGRFVYLLSELDARVDVLAFDAGRGTLSAVQDLPSLPADFNGKPWGADIHVTADGRFLYTSERTSSTLAAFAIDADSGRLTALGHTATETQPRGFNIDPSGRFLFVVGQLSNHLSVYSIDAASGALTAINRCAVGQNSNWVEVLALR